MVNCIKNSSWLRYKQQNDLGQPLQLLIMEGFFIIFGQKMSSTSNGGRRSYGYELVHYIYKCGPIIEI